MSSLSEPIIGSIDVTKIDKARLHNDKYLNFIIFPTEDDKYGNDITVKESISKEERESGVQSKYIGNGKFMSSLRKNSARKTSAAEDESDDIPF